MDDTNAAIHATQDYVAEIGPSRRGGRRVAIGAAALAVLSCLGAGMALSGRSTQAVPAGSASAAPAPTLAAPTPEQLAKADAELKAEFDSGWVKYGDSPAIQGTEVPSAAWVPVFPVPGTATAERRPVYDAPNGNIIGYQFAFLGWVSADRAGSFDSKAERLKRFGCDVALDQQCKENFIDAKRKAIKG